jgi:hypothetical protein
VTPKEEGEGRGVPAAAARPLDAAFSRSWGLLPTADSARRGREAVREVLAEWGVDAEGLEVVTLAAYELIANAVEHAGPPIQIGVGWPAR